jgi:hypothetical protein
VWSGIQSRVLPLSSGSKGVPSYTTGSGVLEEFCDTARVQRGTPSVAT